MPVFEFFEDGLEEEAAGLTSLYFILVAILQASEW